MIATVLVIGRVAVTCVANVLQKQLFRQNVCALTLMLVIWAWMTICMSPWWLGSLAGGWLWRPNWPERAGDWGWMLAACALEMPGNWLLLRSLQRTDLSVYGPLNSFKPVVSILLAMLVLAEYPSLGGLIGIAIVLAGTCLLADRPENGNWFTVWKGVVKHAGVRDRLAAAVLTASASVFLKRAMIGAEESIVLAQWCLLSWLIAVIVWLLVYRLIPKSVSDCEQHTFTDASLVDNKNFLQNLSQVNHDTKLLKLFLKVKVCWIAGLILAMQALTIYLFASIPVGYALSLFQLGGIVSVFLGHRMFGEPHLWRRLLASSIMVIGAIVIICSSAYHPTAK